MSSGRRAARRSAIPHAELGPQVILAPDSDMRRNHRAGFPAKRSVAITWKASSDTRAMVTCPNNPLSWKNGSQPQADVPGSIPVALANANVAAITARLVNTAGLGAEVLPDVNCRITGSSGPPG